jgi:hypothetical protein
MEISGWIHIPNADLTSLIINHVPWAMGMAENEIVYLKSTHDDSIGIKQIFLKKANYRFW